MISDPACQSQAERIRTSPTPPCPSLAHFATGKIPNLESGCGPARLSPGEPNEFVAQIYPRMTVIQQHHAVWLGETDNRNLKELLLPCHGTNSGENASSVPTAVTDKHYRGGRLSCCNTLVVSGPERTYARAESFPATGKAMRPVTTPQLLSLEAHTRQSET